MFDILGCMPSTCYPNHVAGSHRIAGVGDKVRLVSLKVLGEQSVIFPEASELKGSKDMQMTTKLRIQESMTYFFEE